ncbi:MAG: ABC transporter ATP-binding protein [Roseitalea porphyridii]|jgi:ABC-type dipeptide/oligopeptide/nickel transport system ATPase component|uniref:ABC transporter ATP-binding protein n=1 Tax=Roseitalea porphyridii TaxID=1852022 RepID=UPI0032EC96DB
MSLLQIKDLRLTMRSFEGENLVLDGVGLDVDKNAISGIVGETGSGKSLTGLSVSRLVPTPPGRYLGGTIRFDGQDLMRASEEEMRRLRGRQIGMIFQDPTTNLNPAFRISTQMIDIALNVARTDPGLIGVSAGASRAERRRAARRRCVELLGLVGIPEPDSRIDAYPHTYSGGMRQRVLIAMALIGQPRLLIADEPTTALDVSVQAQVLELMSSFVRDRDLTIMFITHNIGVVAQICTDVSVMNTGRIVESGDVHSVLTNPQHGYTRELLGAVMTKDTPRPERRKVLAGSVPS